MRRTCGIAVLLVGLGLSANLFGAAGRLVYGETGRIDQFDPYTGHEASAQRMSDLIFDSLVTVGPGGAYEAQLAEKWTVSKDGTYVDFILRDKVQWHRSKAAGSAEYLTADDVVTTVKLLLAEGSEIPNKERFEAIKAADVIAPLKVRIVFNRAMADPIRLTMFKILPSHVLGSVSELRRGSAFGKFPIGTGPYAFVNANEQGEVLLKAHKEYFKGTPKIRDMILKTYADQNVMAQSLMFNSLDLITYVSPRDLAEVMGDRKLGVIPYDALSYSFFAFNTSKGILKDKRVRQAISLAINRQEMLNAFFGGKGKLISGPFPPTSWAYNLDVKPLPYDIERAKTLFEAAGLKDRNNDKILEDKNGNPIELKFAVPLAGEGEMIKRIVLAFKGYLDAVGIRTKLQFMDWLVWKKKVLGEHDYDVTIASWSFDDASNITSLFHSSSAHEWGNNFVMFNQTKVDALLTEAQATNDFDKRRAIYRKLHAILADEAPYTYLWTLMHHAAHQRKVKGIRVEPFAFFKHVRKWAIREGAQDGT